MAVVCILALPTKLNAQQQPEPRTRILFLLDASGSMTNTWGTNSNESKWASAKKILSEIVDSLAGDPDVELALRVYGHLYSPTQRNCEDTRLEVGFSRNSASYIKTKLAQIKPKGITPISNSLTKAAGDFPKLPGRHIIILMTDGIESCEGDPCEIAKMLETNGIVLKHFVIGFGIQDFESKVFDCVGTNFNVQDENSFKSALNLIMNRILNQTTLQVELLDENKKPLETDINMSFYSAQHHVLQYNLYHTLNTSNRPDTLHLDPVTDYDLVLHTIPEIRLDNVILKHNEHNVIKINAAQGLINYSVQGNLTDPGLVNRLKCVVRDSKTKQIIHVQNLGTSEKYLKGTYDLELLTLPRQYHYGVNVSQAKPQQISITAPGLLNVIKKAEIIGGLFITNKEGKLEKILELASDTKTENIALQPGSYTLVYRLKNNSSMHTTKTAVIEIRSGESQNINPF